jgi:hypothetical protein
MFIVNNRLCTFVKNADTNNLSTSWLCYILITKCFFTSYTVKVVLDVNCYNETKGKNSKGLREA